MLLKGSYFVDIFFGHQKNDFLVFQFDQCYSTLVVYWDIFLKRWPWFIFESDDHDLFVLTGGDSDFNFLRLFIYFYLFYVWFQLFRFTVSYGSLSRFILQEKLIVFNNLSKVFKNSVHACGGCIILKCIIHFCFVINKISNFIH